MSEPRTEAGKRLLDAARTIDNPYLGHHLPDTFLRDAILAIEAAPASLDGLDDPEWPYSFIVNRREYEALVKRARKIEGAAIRLMKVLDLASSVHTSERRAARLALGAALRDEGGTT